MKGLSHHKQILTAPVCRGGQLALRAGCFYALIKRPVYENRHYTPRGEVSKNTTCLNQYVVSWYILEL